jgi:hypothetical protein
MFGSISTAGCHVNCMFACISEIRPLNPAVWTHTRGHYRLESLIAGSAYLRLHAAVLEDSIPDSLIAALSLQNRARGRLTYMVHATRREAKLASLVLPVNLLLSCPARPLPSSADLRLPAPSGEGPAPSTMAVTPEQVEHAILIMYGSAPAPTPTAQGEAIKWLLELQETEVCKPFVGREDGGTGSRFVLVNNHS